MGKKTKILLENPELRTSQEFEITHAERLLKMPNNGGWILPENSNYTFDIDNGIGNKQIKKGNNGAEEKADN